jgi:succinoglycan biosynthesis protein ExoA
VADQATLGGLVTVIIPARNEVDSIETCLDSILTQAGADLQVIVVDNGSDDGTAATVRAYGGRDPRVELVSNPVPSIPRSLNVGLAAARGRWLVRVDAHSTISDGYIARAVGHLRDGGWVGVGGRKDAVAATPTGRAIAAVLGSKLAVGGSVYHHGEVAQVVDHIPFGVYPTELLRRLGGWDESIANNEDFEMDQRLREHGDLYFDPAMRIAWHSRETVSDLFGQYRRYGTGKPQVALAHPDSVKLRHLAPPALVAWLALAAVVSVRHPGVAAAAAAPYAALIGSASLVIARKVPEKRARLNVPAALVAMQVGWGLGFWTGVVRYLRSLPGRP